MIKFTLLGIAIVFAMAVNAQSESIVFAKKKSLNEVEGSQSVELLKETLSDYLINNQVNKKSSAKEDILLLDSIFVENWQFDNPDIWQYKFTYDERNNNTSMVDNSYYNNSYPDELSYRDSTAYAYNDKDLEVFRSGYFAEGDEALEESENIVFKYDDQDRMDTAILTTMEDGFEEVLLAIVSYNEMSQVSSSVIWTTGDDAMVYFKEDYYYTTTLLDSVRGYYNSDDGLTPSEMVEYVYEDVLITNVIEYSFNELGEKEWNHIDEIIYDDNDSPEEITYYFNNYNDEKEAYLKQYFNYEDNEPVLSPVMLVEDDYMDLLSFGKLQSITMEKFENNAWEDAGTIDFYYSDFEIGVSNALQTQSLSVYPNPANNAIYFDFERDEVHDLAIFDLTGKLVLTTNMSAKQAVDVSILKSGYYMIQVSKDGNVVGSTKLVKN